MKKLICLLILGGLFTSPVALLSADKKAEKAKPYPLDVCVVSDEKLGEDPDMKPHVFVHKGQEIKLCCKSCLKDFDKEPAKFIKKMEEAAKKKGK